MSSLCHVPRLTRSRLTYHTPTTAQQEPCKTTLRTSAVPDSAHNTHGIPHERQHQSLTHGSNFNIHQGNHAMPVYELSRGRSAAPEPPVQVKPMFMNIPDAVLVVGLAIAQAVTLTGALVGGHLARKRRLNVEKLNVKLRQVVRELRKQKEEAEQALVCEADPQEGILAYQNALEASLAAPAAPHPMETYGVEGISLASSRRQISKLLMDAKADLAEGRPAEAELKCVDAFVRCEELADKKVMRAVLRVQGAAQKSMQQWRSAIETLRRALQISEEMGNRVGDVDTLGVIADIHVELGEFEEAARLYDEVLKAISTESTETSALSSTWDC